MKIEDMKLHFTVIFPAQKPTVPARTQTAYHWVVQCTVHCTINCTASLAQVNKDTNMCNKCVHHISIVYREMSTVLFSQP